MKISWMAKKSNDTLLKEAHTSRALVNKIRTRQTTFFDHVMRREKLEHLITTGMMEGKRSRGKQLEKMTNGLVNWLGAGKVVESLVRAKLGRNWLRDSMSLSSGQSVALLCVPSFYWVFFFFHSHVFLKRE